MTSYSTADCRALHHPRTAKALFYEPVTRPVDIINVENTTEPDPNLVLMSCPFPHPTRATILTHNCQIKDQVVKLIMYNGSQKNLVSTALVKALALLWAGQKAA
jgi:hypothetical protein|uniref:Uncharacterized protein n=1 Tax=Picea glauca TaxID=3330 RepID=A0A124GNH5_PICGL|nr:hypothetical protein ABT39_MTgene4168 [Picea glauca]